MTLKEEYEKRKKDMYEHAEQILRVTDFHDGTLYMGTACDQSTFRKRVWEDSVDAFLRDNIDVIRLMAHDMIIAEIGEDK